MDWDSWRDHIDAEIKETGQWVGLADEDWQPLCDLPAHSEMSAGAVRLDHGELEVAISTGREGAVHRAVEELIADQLGVFDDQGLLVPNMAKARNVIVARPGRRQAYFVTHATATGAAEQPTSLRIFGQDLTGYLAATPCPSIPGTWGVNPVQTWTKDAGGSYTTPRDYGPVEMADVADGYAVRGPAVGVIRDLVQDSIDAVCAQQKWSRPHLVVDMAGPSDSPEVTVRTDDQSVWEAIVEPARTAGVTVDVDLWWPGDMPVLVRSERGKPLVATSWAHPIGIVRVEKVEEV